ncbi:MAG: hypothetical protein EPO42_14185 [Gallionellaceae bacterium]|nr:MAG: hypothetical protein EPO42_14185 [Gallionellaceae bacterium]
MLVESNQSGASGAGSAAVANPIMAVKVIFLVAVIILVIFLLWKFMKGISSITGKLGELGPMSEEEKKAIVLSPEYQAGLKWLDDRIGIETVVRKGKFKKVSDYLTKKGVSASVLASSAEQIYKAVSGGVSEDEPAIYTAIASLPTKATVSLMAQVFNTVYAAKYTGGKRLAAYLSAYLDLTEMQTLTEIINKKPEL